MAQHNELGIRGEKIAVDFLIRNGYKILAKNWRFGRFELDIVAEHKETLIIVEVKTRVSNFMANPDETISKTKQRNLIRCANAYIQEHEIDLETQFDIVSIILDDKQPIIDHLQDAFYPG